MAYVESHGASIYYERHGDGPALVFAHGGGGNGTIWWQQIPCFAREFTCITFDHRCFGRSTPATSEHFLPEYFADDAIAILDAEGIHQAGFVCQSMGGMTGLRVALHHPERIWAFVSGDSPLGITHERMLKDILGFFSEIGDRPLEVAATSKGFKDRSPTRLYLYGQINAFNPFTDRGQGNPEPSATLARTFAPEFLLDPSVLAQIACPTLFVVGSEDPIVTPEVTRDLVARTPGSELLEIHGAGHSPYFEEPDVFNGGVLRFLKSVLPDPSA